MLFLCKGLQPSQFGIHWDPGTDTLWILRDDHLKSAQKFYSIPISPPTTYHLFVFVFPVSFCRYK